MSRNDSTTNAPPCSCSADCHGPTTAAIFDPMGPWAIFFVFAVFHLVFVSAVLWPFAVLGVLVDSAYFALVSAAVRIVLARASDAGDGS